MPTRASLGPGRRSKSNRRKRRPWLIRGAQIVLALAVIGGIFVVVIPKIASYSEVWRILSRLSGGQITLLVAVTALNVFTYWPQMVAAMPGLTLAQAAVNNQSSTAIANTVPAGGAIAVGVAYAEFRSWGFSNADIALLALVTGVWNTLIKLGMPVVALAILAIEGTVGPGLLTATFVGLAGLAVSIALLTLVLWSERFAQAIGDRVGRIVSPLRRLARKAPVTDGGRVAADFRRQSLDLVRRRWVALTVTTIVSHVGLYFVLLIAARDVGIPGDRVTWAEIFGVFAFARLVSAIPVTPGGVGVVELSYIGGLVLAGAGRPQAVAAVLVFRGLTYLFQIAIGPVAYLVWQRKKSWRVDEDGRRGREGSRQRRNATGSRSSGTGSRESGAKVKRPAAVSGRSGNT